jgi:hypothetical protein
MRKLVCVAVAAMVLQGCNCGGPNGGTSLTDATVEVDRAAGVLANGTDEATVTVTLRTKDGTPVAGQTVELAATGDGNTLSQPAGPTDKSGVAKGALRSTRAEVKTVTATLVEKETRTALAATPTVTFVAAAAARLVYRVQPTTVVAGAVIAQAVELAIEDEAGNVPDVNTPVTLALSPDGTLGGTVTVAAVHGVVRFADLTVAKAGTGYTLSASAPGLSVATSAPFSVLVGAASRLAFAVQPSSTVATSPVSPAVVVRIEDAQGNLVTGETATVSLALAANPGGAALGGTTSAAAAGGLASFAALTLDKSGTGYTLAASASGLASATSAGFDVTAGAAVRLVFAVQPTHVIVGAAIAPVVVVRIEDANGNLVTGATDTVSLALGANPGGSSLGGATSTAAVGGLVTFATLTLDKAGSGYTLAASAAGLGSVTSAAFDVSPGAAAQLVFAVQPTQLVAGATMAPAVELRFEDAHGNPVTLTTNVVSLALGANPGSATLGGATASAAVSGVASFSTLTLNKSGAGYTLVASASGVPSVTSAAFDVTAGSAVRLAFAVQPTHLIAGAAVAPAVVARIEDANGNLVTGATDMVSLALSANPGGSSLGGATSAAAVCGLATFATLTLDKAGSGYTLAASAAGLSGVTSTGFDVSPGAAARLAFGVQPANLVAGAVMAPALELRVEDAHGNSVPVATDTVSLALGANPGSATLGGATTAAAASGVASFSTLTLNKSGTGYTLVASAAGLTSATSAGFDVGPASPAKLDFVVQPGNAVAGAAFTPAPVVRIEDAFGNLVTAGAPSVTVGVNPGGTTLAGVVTVAASGGAASFEAVALNKRGVGYTLLATSPGLSDATSAAFDVAPAAPSALLSTVTANPATLLADGLAASTVTVTVFDAFSNTVPGASVLRSEGDAGCTVTQPLAVTTDGGEATASVTSTKAQTLDFFATVAPSVLLTQPATITFLACTPGSVQPCYEGAAGTLGVGPCTGGSSTCTAAGAWGACVGQVVPSPEVCANSIDEDCNGIVDDVPDTDGDGWTRCNGDCCETTAECAVPSAVNPGAMEVVGNGVDDDCDPSTSDVTPAAPCSAAEKFSAVSALDAASAMDLCKTTTLNPPLAQKRWGLISAQFTLANGATPSAADLTAMQNQQAAVMTHYGTGGIIPRKGSTMLGLSNGTMRGAADPGFVSPISGTAFTSAIAFPGAPPLSTYLNVHAGGLYPGQCGTVTCPTGTGANDSVVLRLTMRAPTNAHGFSYDVRFFSAEYQTFQCTAYNDYFLAMLTSGFPGIPPDRNISFDMFGNALSVNNNFLSVCNGNGKYCGSCPWGVAELAGTGMDAPVNGAGTRWLTTDAPVVPGEVITLQFVLFDVGDHIYDTNVLLDSFRWNTAAYPLSTHY